MSSGQDCRIKSTAGESQRCYCLRQNLDPEDLEAGTGGGFSSDRSVT